MISKKDNLISTTAIVEKYGLPYSTINHYTIIGLLPVESRRRNKRLYNEEDVRERLLKIAELQNQGYPLQLIRKEIEKTALNKEVMHVGTVVEKENKNPQSFD